MNEETIQALTPEKPHQKQMEGSTQAESAADEEQEPATMKSSSITMAAITTPDDVRIDVPDSQQPAGEDCTEATADTVVSPRTSKMRKTVTNMINQSQARDQQWAVAQAT